MNIYKYDIMNYILEEGYTNQRIISEHTGYSLGKVNKVIREMVDGGYLNEDFFLTEKSHDLIEARKPKNAIILASSRGIKKTSIGSEIPKGLLEVEGQPLIERLILQLHEVGIFDIKIVVGFLKEKYDYLIDRYGVELVYNPNYEEKSTTHSLAFVLDKISNTYIVPSDIWADENPFSSREMYSWYLVSDELDGESYIRMNRQRELVTTEPGEKGNTMLGISYLLEEEANVLHDVVVGYIKDKDYDTSFWEEALFSGQGKITIYGKRPSQNEVAKIANYEELKEVEYKSKDIESDIMSLICREMGIGKDEIEDVLIMQKGMTNNAFKFTVKGKQYMMRIPGEGTEELINRGNEYEVYEKLKGKKISDEIIYFSVETGYKISEFLNNARECNPFDWDDVRLCMETLRNFHEMDLSVGHSFDIFEEIDYYEELWQGTPSIFRDYKETKEKIMGLEQIIERFPKEYSLTHIDANSDNFLITEDEVRLIDWEYAAMQDPHLDVAMFAIYSLYDREYIDKVIDIYFQGNCQDDIRMKIYCYIAAGGLLWSNWCEYKRLYGVEFGDYSLRKYRYAKDFYKIVERELEPLAIE